MKTLSAAWLFMVAFLLVTSPALSAGDLPAAPGVIQPNVSCLSDSDMTYALYLPTGFTEDRLWPVLVCLDPAARGIVPVERFREGAEQHGFILIGSNHARNYDSRSVERSLTAIFNDLGNRYPIHANGVYGTGFSGGARVALTLASRFGHFQGVIACGAGFDPRYPPDPFGRFPVLMTLGQHDSNYCAMRIQYRDLRKYGRDVGMLLFDGVHDWPKEADCMRALGWLRIRAMASGAAPRDNAWQQTFLSDLMTWAEQLAGENRLLEAMCAMELVEESQAEKANLMDRIQQLRSRADMQKMRSDEYEMVQWEMGQMKEIEAIMAHARQPALDIQERSGLRQWVRSRARNYADMCSDTDPMQAVAGERMLDFLWRRPFEGIMIEMADHQYDQAIRLGELALIVQPDNWAAHYNIACAASRKGDLRTAFQSLEQAIETGLQNPEQIWSDADLGQLTSSSKYRKKLERLVPSTPKGVNGD